MTDSRDYKRRFKRELQKFVRILRLESGHIHIKVHQGNIPVVEIDHRVRIRLDPHSPSREHPGQATAEAFVINHLEPLVRDMLEYGRVVANVDSGNVDKFRLELDYRIGEQDEE